MLTPTPMLRPSPLDVSGLFAGTFAALKQRFGLFVLIALLPLAVSIVLIGGGVAIAISAGVISSIGRSSSALPVGVLVGLALFIVGIIATLLAQVKSQGMMTVAAYEIAQGGRPDVRGLLARTRGFLPRMVPVIAIGFGVVIAVYAAIFALTFGAIGASTTGGRGSGGAAAAGLIVVMVLMFLLLIPLAVFIQTKLLYTIPSIAIEQLGGIDGMRRSWGLTRGAFWRTLGYYLVASVSVAAVSYVVSFVSQLAMTPMMAGMNRTSNPSEVLAGLAAMIPLFLLTLVLQMAVQLLTLPFVQSYVAYMFIDQVRRTELPAAPYGFGSTPPAYGYPAQGPFYPQPGQGYPQPGQGYPQPGQGYPQPGQGYPQPGPQHPQPGQGYPQPGPQYPQPGQGYPPPSQYPNQGGWQVPPANQGQQPPQQD